MTEIRPAAPEDVNSIAILLDMSAKGHVQRSIFELMFPGTEEQRIEKLKWLVLNGHRLTLHYDCLTVAEVDGKTAAVGGSRAHKQNSTVDWALTFRDMGLSFTEIFRIYLRMRPFYKVEPHVSKDTIELFAGATALEYRRHGVFEKLSQVMIEKLLQEGKYQKFVVGCFIGNKPMESFLNRFNPEKVESKYSKSFEKIFNCPGSQVFTFFPNREKLDRFHNKS